MYCVCSFSALSIIDVLFWVFLQFASKSSDQQTSLQIIRDPQIAAIKSVRLSEDQAKGRKELLPFLLL